MVVMVGGEVVVNLAGGHRDLSQSEPWTPDTVVDVYSAGKAVVGLSALRAVEAGLIGLDEPIASLWPEYACKGKAKTTLRQSLCHRAGVPAIREPLTDNDLWSWDRMTGAIASTEPWWVPGERHAYHTNTYGHLVGEIVRRATGLSPVDAVAEIAAIAGDAQIAVGLPASWASHCADVQFDSEVDPRRLALPRPDGDAAMALYSYFNPPGYSSIGVVNSRRWRSAAVPSTNMHASAKGLASVYAGLLSPGLLLGEELLAVATSPQSKGPCPILGEDVVFGLGFKPTTARRPFGVNPGAFGHFGTGGSVGFADPEAGVAFGYVMNHVVPRWQSTRNRALIDALYRAL